MATITTDLICNLNQPVAATFLHGNLFSQDNAGNTINVHVMDNGEPATIGGTVSANVIRADGNTVAVSGSLSGNQCSVVLPQACYAVPGRVEIIIKLTQSTTITTIAAIVANVYRSTTDTIIDPGTIIPSIQTLIAEIEEAVDSIPVDYSGLLHTIAADYSSSNTYQVGQYAWQGGVLKRCIVPITTAETYTAAHWTNAVIGDDLTNLKSAFDNYQYMSDESTILLTEGTESGWFNGTSIVSHATYKHIEIDSPRSKGVRYVMLYLAQVTTLGTIWLIKNGQAYKYIGSANNWVMINVAEDIEKIYINFWDDTYAVNVKLICNSPTGIGIVESIIKSFGKYYNPAILWFPGTTWRFTDGAELTNTAYSCTQIIKSNNLPKVSFVSGTGADTYINVWNGGTTAGYYLVRTGVWRSPSGSTISEPVFDEYAVCYNGQDTENCILTYPSIEDIKTTESKVVILPDIEKQNATLDNVRQISVIGDSIAHGANCPVMYEDAWASIMRGFLQYQYGNKNYGYAHLLSSISNQATYNEIHSVTLGNGWSGTNYDSRSIGGYSISNTSSASDVTITTRKPQKNFRLIYSTGTGYGSFEVLVNGTSKGTVNTAGSAGNYNLTPVYEGDENNNFTITIHKLDSNPVVLNGIYYFDNWNTVMLNNYAYSGIKLTDIPNDVLTECCDADMVFFCLGTNGYSTQADYTASIDHIISQFSNDSVINNRLLIVMNFMWQTKEVDSFVKRENRRLADSVPHSAYIDFNEVLGNLTTAELQTIGFLNYDSAHPTPAGHKFIAEYTATALNLICRLKSMIGKY